MPRIVLLAFALLFAASAHANREFTGTTPSGAYYRIAVPDNWKSGDTLILFQHGLTFEPPGPNPDRASPVCAARPACRSPRRPIPCRAVVCFR